MNFLKGLETLGRKKELVYNAFQESRISIFLGCRFIEIHEKLFTCIILYSQNL